MSLICLCVVDNIKDKNEEIYYMRHIEKIARNFNCGIRYGVDWFEPFVSHIKTDSLIINIVDFPKCYNCEMLLLPDGWYVNGYTNKLEFRDRIKLLQDISSFLMNKNNQVSFYIAESGTNLDEFFDVILENSDIVNYLTSTIGVYGLEYGIHIRICQKNTNPKNTGEKKTGDG